MPIHPSDSELVVFWAWFATIADELGDDFDHQGLPDELTARFAGLGEIIWELGTGSADENMLAISPDGPLASWRPIPVPSGYGVGEDAHHVSEKFPVEGQRKPQRKWHSQH